MKTIQKLQVLFLIMGITGFFYGCQKEEQLKTPAKPESSHIKSSDTSAILEYDKVISDMVEYGGIEISPEKIGLDLKELPFQEYLDYRLFQTRTGLFLVLKYDRNSPAYKQAQGECDKNYSTTKDIKTGEITSMSCDATGNSCCYFISVDSAGKEWIRIVTTA